MTVRQEFLFEIIVTKNTIFDQANLAFDVTKNDCAMWTFNQKMSAFDVSVSATGNRCCCLGITDIKVSEKL
jgi:hypothetical protein